MEGFGQLVLRIAELERRLSRMMLHGTVTDVDPQKHRIRVRVGGSDEQPQKSAWIAYAQIAGALKLHSMPSVGQQMMVLMPDAVPEQSCAIPLIWSDQNPSPSNDKDEHVMVFGQVKVTVKTDLVEIRVGDAVITLKPDQIEEKVSGAVRTITSSQIRDAADRVDHN